MGKRIRFDKQVAFLHDSLGMSDQTIANLCMSKRSTITAIRLGKVGEPSYTLAVRLIALSSALWEYNKEYMREDCHGS